MATPAPKRRWCYPTPGWLVAGLLASTGLLFSSQRFRWFPFNQHKGWTVLMAVASVGLVLAMMLLWLAVAAAFGRRFQFSIRSLLVMMVATALPFGWLSAELRKAREQQATVAAITKKGDVEYDWTYDAHGGYFRHGRPPVPAWLRRLLGGDFFAEVVSVGYANSPKPTDADVAQLNGLNCLERLYVGGDLITDEALAHVARMPRLQKLSLSAQRITDAGLAKIAGMTQLRDLYVIDAKTTDAGVARISALTGLQQLRLTGPGITDEGMRHVARLTNLRWMNLADTQVTDAGLARLAGLSRLEDLSIGYMDGRSISNGKMTGEGIRRLSRALPNCKIK